MLFNCKSLKPSKRKELEITDLLENTKKNKLKVDFIGRGTWLDTGNIQDFYNATNYGLSSRK